MAAAGSSTHNFNRATAGSPNQRTTLTAQSSLTAISTATAATKRVAHKRSPEKIISGPAKKAQAANIGHTGGKGAPSKPATTVAFEAWFSSISRPGFNMNTALQNETSAATEPTVFRQPKQQNVPRLPDEPIAAEFSSFQSLQGGHEVSKQQVEGMAGQTMASQSEVVVMQALSSGERTMDYNDNVEGYSRSS